MVAASRLSERPDSAPVSSPESGTFDHPNVVGTGEHDVVKDEVYEEPGVIDRLAAAEDALSASSDILSSIAEEIETIGREFKAATAEMNRGDSQAAGFGHRLIIAKRLAKRLAEPVERIWSAGNEYARKLQQVDDGFRWMIEAAPEEVQKQSSSREQICAFFRTLRELSHNANTALGHVREMSDASGSMERHSRDLRPPLRRLRQALAVLLESGGVIAEWVRLADSSGIEC